MTQTVPDISPLMPMHQDPLLGCCCCCDSGDGGGGGDGDVHYHNHNYNHFCTWCFGGVVAVTAARLASRHAESQIIARMERMELLMACHQLLPSIPSPCSPYPGRYLQHPMRSLGLLKISHMRAQDHPIRSNLHHPMTPFTKARRRWCS